MKKSILSMTSLIFVVYANGQLYQTSENGPKPKIVENAQLKFNLLSPGIDFELGIFKNQTLVGGLGLGLAYYEEGYAFGLALNSEYRYYHNLDRRINNDKVIAGNSGNYLGAARSIYFNPLIFATDIPSNNFNIGYYGLIYGIQRTYESGFNFDVSSGVGYYLGDGIPSGYGPFLNIKIGWVATKRKKKAIYFKEN
ncbi:MAG: hypothetical protein HKP38_08370 [Croceitalea sp.]|nr:hypothetical protein [Croceitalea sp.]NNL09221.1 hypothetical protein [Croceitalea sp.]NNM17405.1 hypothetical protein [Croceitalea sp.]